MNPTEAYQADGVGRDGDGSGPDDPRVLRAVEEYLAALEAGVAPNRAEFLGRYADIAARLGEYLDGLELIHRAAPAAGASGAGDAGDDLAGAEPLGDFLLLREIGRGGMGVVYAAVQRSLNRTVALKVLPFAAALDDRQIQRFKNEAQAAAGLHHPNIVPVFGVGCERGVHYYAMQLIDGRTLAALIAEQRRASGRPESPAAEPTAPHAPGAPSADTAPRAAASTERAPRDLAHFRRMAELGLQAAEALDHAHQLGVVHRDVKPANLMLDGRGGLWVTDFGLAQVQSDARLTMTGDLMGTLRYMSPEQALARRVVIDHRTDVYSLGATLYELLTLEPVFGGSDRQELLRQIAFEEPKAPRRINKAIPAELEVIALKAMEKNPADRYGTAKELADDLRRFLEDKPIQARPAGLAKRLQKWGRRHRAVVTTASALGILALATLVVSTVLIASAYAAEAKHRQDAENAEGHEKEQRHVAEEERDLADHHLYIARMLLAKQACDAGDWKRCRELLDSVGPAPGRPDFRAWEWHYLQAQCHKALLSLGGPGQRIDQADWSPDGSRFVTVSVKEGRANMIGAPDSEPSEIAVWDAATMRQLLVIRERISGVWWSPDGQRLAGGGDGFVKVWDASTGQALLTLGLDGRLAQAAWSPDGQRLLTITQPTPHSQPGQPVTLPGFDTWSVTVWDLNTRASLFSRKGAGAVAQPWSSDGRWVVINKIKAGTGQGQAPAFPWMAVCDARTGEELANLQHKAAWWQAAWGPDPTRLAVVEQQEQTGLKVVEVPTGREALAIDARGGMWDGIEWSADGRRLLAHKSGGTHEEPDRGCVWDAASGKELFSFSGEEERGVRAGFSPDGRRVATLGAWGTTRVWDVVAGRRLLSSRFQSDGPMNPFDPPVWSPDGRRLMIRSEGRVEIWDATADRDALRLHATDDFFPLNGAAIALAWSPDGRRLAAAGATNMRNRNQRPGQWYKEIDGTTGIVPVWDADTGEQLMALQAHPNDVNCVAWRPDGQRLATVGGDYEQAPDDPPPAVPDTLETWSRIKLWDAATGQKVKEWRAHSFPFTFQVAWSPDGKQLASIGVDSMWNGRWVGEQGRADGNGGVLPAAVTQTERFRAIKIWDAATAREVFSISSCTFSHDEKRGKAPDPNVGDVAALDWSPDGKRLVAYGGPLYFWDTSTWKELLTIANDPEGGGDSRDCRVAWSPDGGRIAVARKDIKVWDVDGGKMVVRMAGHSAGILAVAWSPDGQRLVSAGRDGLLKFWDLATGEQVLSLTGGFKENASVAWSPDGKRLATSDGHGVKLWDTERHDSWLPAVADLDNRLARAWVANDDPQLRDPARAVRSASEAVALAPRIGVYWATLGMAQYRAGKSDEAIRSLERSIELRWGGDGAVYCYLAMANWQKGDKEQARKWYDKAVLWVEEAPWDSGRQTDEIRRLRVEAAALLHIKEPPSEQPPSTDQKGPASGK